MASDIVNQEHTFLRIHDVWMHNPGRYGTGRAGPQEIIHAAQEIQFTWDEGCTGSIKSEVQFLLDRTWSYIEVEIAALDAAMDMISLVADRDFSRLRSSWVTNMPDPSRLLVVDSHERVPLPPRASAILCNGAPRPTFRTDPQFPDDKSWSGWVRAIYDHPLHGEIWTTAVANLPLADAQYLGEAKNALLEATVRLFLAAASIPRERYVEAIVRPKDLYECF